MTSGLTFLSFFDWNNTRLLPDFADDAFETLLLFALDALETSLATSFSGMTARAPALAEALLAFEEALGAFET